MQPRHVLITVALLERVISIVWIALMTATFAKVFPDAWLKMLRVMDWEDQISTVAMQKFNANMGDVVNSPTVLGLRFNP
jgi:hypothetical protein